jgi:hypothetical protein
MVESDIRYPVLRSVILRQGSNNESTYSRSWETGGLLADCLIGKHNLKCPFEIAFSSEPKLGHTHSWMNMYCSSRINRVNSHLQSISQSPKATSKYHLNLHFCYKYPSKPRHLWSWAALKWPRWSSSPFSLGSIFSYFLLSLSIKLYCYCYFAICVSPFKSLFRTPGTWDLLYQGLLRPPTLQYSLNNIDLNQTKLASPLHHL